MGVWKRIAWEDHIHLGVLTLTLPVTVGEGELVWEDHIHLGVLTPTPPQSQQNMGEGELV